MKRACLLSAALFLFAPLAPAGEPAPDTFVSVDSESTFLVKPRAFYVDAPGFHGRVRKARWRSWGSSRAAARGRISFCATMADCHRGRTRIVARERKLVTCVEGSFYLYSEVRVYGRFPGSRTKLFSPLHPCGARFGQSESARTCGVVKTERTWERRPGQSVPLWFRVVVRQGRVSCGRARFLLRRYLTDNHPCPPNSGNTCQRKYAGGWTCLAPSAGSYPRIAACSTPRRKPKRHIVAYDAFPTSEATQNSPPSSSADSAFADGIAARSRRCRAIRARDTAWHVRRTAGTISCRRARFVVRYVLTHSNPDPTVMRPGRPPPGWECGFIYGTENGHFGRIGPECTRGRNVIIGYPRGSRPEPAALRRSQILSTPRPARALARNSTSRALLASPQSQR